MRKSTRRLLAAALAAAFCLPAAAAELAGEWSRDADRCNERRFSFADDGTHTAWRNYDGEWMQSGSGTYSRDGDTVTVKDHEETHVVDIVELTDEHILLRNQDPERRARAKAETGSEVVEFVRCPAR